MFIAGYGCNIFEEGEGTYQLTANPLPATAGQVVIAKVNTQWLEETARKFNITSIPTLALMREGLEVDRLMGARPAADILGFVERLLR